MCHQNFSFLETMYGCFQLNNACEMQTKSSAMRGPRRHPYPPQGGGIANSEEEGGGGSQKLIFYRNSNGTKLEKLIVYRNLNGTKLEVAKGRGSKQKTSVGGIWVFWNLMIISTPNNLGRFILILGKKKSAYKPSGPLGRSLSRFL